MVDDLILVVEPLEKWNITTQYSAWNFGQESGKLQSMGCKESDRTEQLSLFTHAHEYSGPDPLVMKDIFEKRFSSHHSGYAVQPGGDMI